MPLFTFYACQPDGGSTAFETIECLDDATALSRAPRVLDDHLSAVEVVVWHGERRVGALSRVPALA